MNFYLHKGEVYREDTDGPASYHEHRPRGARRITEDQARDVERRAAAANDAEFEVRQEKAERARSDAAAEAAERRQALADALVEAGLPPEVAEQIHRF